MSAEQKERMEKNRRLAMEKRMAKVGKTPTGKRFPQFNINKHLKLLFFFRAFPVKIILDGWTLNC